MEEASEYGGKLADPPPTSMHCGTYSEITTKRGGHSMLLVVLQMPHAPPLGCPSDPMANPVPPPPLKGARGSLKRAAQRKERGRWKLGSTWPTYLTASRLGLESPQRQRRWLWSCKCYMRTVCPKIQNCSLRLVTFSRRGRAMNSTRTLTRKKIVWLTSAGPGRMAEMLAASSGPAKQYHVLVKPT